MCLYLLTSPRLKSPCDVESTKITTDLLARILKEENLGLNKGTGQVAKSVILIGPSLLSQTVLTTAQPSPTRCAVWTLQ